MISKWWTGERWGAGLAEGVTWKLTQRKKTGMQQESYSIKHKEQKYKIDKINIIKHNYKRNKTQSTTKIQDNDTVVKFWIASRGWCFLMQHQTATKLGKVFVKSKLKIKDQKSEVRTERHEQNNFLNILNLPTVICTTAKEPQSNKQLN